MNKPVNQSDGFTLIELVVGIVILSVGTAAFLTLITNTAKNSVDPQIRVQGNAIARAYLEEIMLSSFCDPDWDHDSNAATALDCPAQCTSSACTSCNAVGSGWTVETRDTYDDVCDYDSITNATATDRNGFTLGNVSDYTVTVSVNDVGVSLNTNTTSNAGQVVRVDVDVTHTSGTSMQLSSFKTNY
ncbi:MAG: type IV pilus modification PilV family protein [Gammaproteobacteria bacterium]|jgi:MSHA pilin protein MshD